MSFQNNTLRHKFQKQCLKFFYLKSCGNFLLLLCTFLALYLANSHFAADYHAYLHSPLLVINLFAKKIPLTLFEIINEGLMTLFFLLVTLEIKREIIEGELNSKQKAMLPAISALGGMLLPALIFILLNKNSAQTLNAWGIPIATDIAFSLGVLSLLGNRIPSSLKVFLTALAIIDDLLAILIIAFFYTKELNIVLLCSAGVIWLLLCLVNYRNIKNNYVYIFLGIILWLLLLPSGIHATIAGVLIACIIPMHGPAAKLKTCEERLQPWVTFLILPIFALVNAGLVFKAISWQTFLQPLPLGIFLGLVVGKPVGILLFTGLALKSEVATLSPEITLRQLIGVAMLCGIGFTMSLFIGDLAFATNDYVTDIRLGVFAGSLISGIFGYLFLMKRHHNAVY